MSLGCSLPLLCTGEAGDPVFSPQILSVLSAPFSPLLPLRIRSTALQSRIAYHPEAIDLIPWLWLLQIASARSSQ